MSYFKLPDQKTVYFDVDDTLVLWEMPITAANEHEFVKFDFPDENYSVMLKPHQKHIQDLKACYNSNYNVVVWSQGGSDWAAMVVKKLGLSEYVDIIVNKPDFWYDDLTNDYVLEETFRRWKQP